MGFFDLNIPYQESDKHIADKSAKKTARLKQIVKAMELGYSGVAFNRTIKGVMADCDRCSIPLFSLSSLLKLSPSLSSAVELHRKVINVPVSSPFRQYTRLTVVVESPSQASSLNSSNPVLKSYDIVAVKPVNQISFEQACRISEVDLIAIDFSDRMPFRLKQPLVKAAVERGVYFEITYSALIMDARVRKHIISNAKLLVDWTQGKNIILSSAAPSVTELRGPYDVANLSSLLGLSMERAKAAISKSCRSVIANALRKKHFYKEAIRVEPLNSDAHVDFKDSSSDGWLKWDPISSGDGDLLLDDLAKSFCVSRKVTKSPKAIDFSSVINSLPSQGLQIKDFIPSTGSGLNHLDICKKSTAVAETELLAMVCAISEQPEQLNSSSEGHISLNSMLSKDAKHDFDGSKRLLSPSVANEIESSSISTLGSTEILGLETHYITIVPELPDLPELPELPQSLNGGMYDVARDDSEPGTVSEVMDIPDSFVSSIDVNTSPIKHYKEAWLVNEDEPLITECVDLDDDLVRGNKENKDEIALASRGLSLHEFTSETEQFSAPKDDSVMKSDCLSTVDSYNELKYNEDSEVNHGRRNVDIGLEEQSQTVINHSSLPRTVYGKGSLKHRKSHIKSIFPLRRLLNPVPFKKRTKKFKIRS